MSKTYLVFLAPDGSGEEFLGRATSLRKAKKMAAEHARGERSALAEHLYATARAAGDVNGVSAPPKNLDLLGEPVEWFGRGGWYCACVEGDEPTNT